jgi:hypothetical protein
MAIIAGKAGFGASMSWPSLGATEISLAKLGPTIVDSETQPRYRDRAQRSKLTRGHAAATAASTGAVPMP